MSKYHVVFVGVHKNGDRALGEIMYEPKHKVMTEQSCSKLKKILIDKYPFECVTILFWQKLAEDKEDC